MDKGSNGNGYAMAGLAFMALGLVAGAIMWRDSGSLAVGVSVVIGMTAVALPLMGIGQLLGAVRDLRTEVSRLDRKVRQGA